MADKILGTLLRPLERIYKFPSAQKGSPDSFELDLPIQPVHDLSRLAGIRSSVVPINDGFWMFTSRHVHAGAGSLQSTPSIFDTTLSVANGFPANRGGGAIEQAWWIYRVYSSSNTLNEPDSTTQWISHGSATVGPYATGATLQLEPMMFEKNFGIFWTAAYYGVNNDNKRFYGVNFPIRVLTNPTSTVSEFWGLKSIATGAVTVTFNMRFWLGPIGVMPPGQ